MQVKYIFIIGKEHYLIIKSDSGKNDAIYDKYKVFYL